LLFGVAAELVCYITIAAELELAVLSQHSRLTATIKLRNYATALCLVKRLKFNR